MLYEILLKRLMKRRTNNSEVTALEIFLLGALAKLGATVVTYPLLVVKSRLQAKQLIGGDKRLQYRGTLDIAILKMIRYEGFYGFYKGMGTKIVQSVLEAAVLFMVKEELRRRICACMDFLVNSGRSIYLPKKYLLNSQILLWASTLLEMECRTKIGYLLLPSTASHAKKGQLNMSQSVG